MRLAIIHRVMANFVFFSTLCHCGVVSVFADTLESGKFREFSGKKGFS